jgi:hypothetical protein
MDEDLKNFTSWFSEVIATLYPRRETGFAIILITFPLLERYLRQRQCPSMDLDDRHMDDLVKLFPELTARPVAWEFWKAYRHGLLHKLTFNTKDKQGRALPIGGLTHDIPETIRRLQDGFWVNPVKFSQAVLSAIEADFPTFAQDRNGEYALPRVTPLPRNQLSTTVSYGTNYPYSPTNRQP